jgi:hypothetical protein
MGGVHALNIPFIRDAARDLGIETDLEFYEKLAEYEDASLEILNRKNPKTGVVSCSGENEEQCLLEVNGDKEKLRWMCKNCKEMAEKGREE